MWILEFPKCTLGAGASSQFRSRLPPEPCPLWYTELFYVLLQWYFFFFSVSLSLYLYTRHRDFIAVCFQGVVADQTNLPVFCLLLVAVLLLDIFSSLPSLEETDRRHSRFCCRNFPLIPLLCLLYSVKCQTLRWLQCDAHLSIMNQMNWTTMDQMVILNGYYMSTQL